MNPAVQILVAFYLAIGMVGLALALTGQGLWAVIVVLLGVFFAPNKIQVTGKGVKAKSD